MARDETATILLAGIDTKGVPFLLRFDSLLGFEPHLRQGGFREVHLGIVVDGDMKQTRELSTWVNGEFSGLISRLKALPGEPERIREATRDLLSTLQQVSVRDENVGTSFDLVNIGLRTGYGESFIGGES